MRLFKSVSIMLVVAFLPVVASAQPPRRQQRGDGEHVAAVSTSSIVDRIIKREQDEMTAFALYKPLIETYIQELRPDRKMGFLPDRDHYYFGQIDLGRGVAVKTMLSKSKFGFLTSEFRSDFEPEGFLELAYVDRNHFDKKDYTFHYAGEDFLGDVRCLMFDLQPLRKHGSHFTGRIWVEDRNYTIVRFSGEYVPKIRWGSFFTHFDSWRMNVQPDLWLPAYVFTEELHPSSFDAVPRFKGQTRFWGYNLKPIHPEDQYSDIFVDPETQVQDDSARENHDLSPVQQERAFERQAEDNAIETLSRSGVLAPEGPVDKVLDTVLNNLEVTNNLEIEPEPRCRVMLTSDIELFSIGHTIVLSRGLLDVIPDEATLAVMLAQELSDSMLLKESVDQYGFSDVLQIPTVDAVRVFSFRDSQTDWRASGARTLELLRNSPYRGNLGTAALFLKQLSIESKLLPHLVSPRLGNKVYPVGELINSGPALEPEKIDQIAARPIGSRIKVNPWDDQIALNKAKAVPLYSAREKMPFEVTPFMPFLTRYSDTQTTDATVVRKDDAQSPPEK